MSPTPELRSLLKLAFPISLAYLAGMAMQLVDMMFIGPLGAEAIGGVSLGNAVFAVFLVVGMGILFGLDYLMSHAFGAGKPREAGHYLVQALYLATLMFAPMEAAMQLLSWHYQGASIEPGIARLAGEYLRSVSWSLWPFLLFQAFRQYLQATGIAMPATVIVVLANGVNALGNWALVYGHLGFRALGVPGSGYATCLSRLTMFAMIALYALWRDRRAGHGLRATPLGLSVAHVRRIVALGIPAGAQTLLEVGAFSTASMLAGRLGAVPLAAHQIVLQIASFSFMIPLGISSASAVRVAQSLGEGDRARARRFGWAAIALGAATMGTLGIGMYLGSSWLLRLFTRDGSVIAAASGLLLIAAFFQVSDSVQVTSTGTLRGVGNTRASMIANLVGHWLIGLPVGLLLCFKLGYGVWGLWIGLSIGLTAVAGTLVGAWRAAG